MRFRLPRAWLSDTLFLGLLTSMVALIGVAFVLPWLPREPTGGADLNRYAPLEPGYSNLTATLDATGAPRSWSSSSVRSLSRLSPFNDIRLAPSAAIMEALSESDPDSLEAIRATATVLAINRRELASDNTISEMLELFLRDSRGLQLVGWEDAEGRRSTFFKPPLLLLPAGLKPGQQWLSEGVVGSTPYRWTGQILTSGSYSGAAGEFDDCLDVATELTFGSNDSATTRSRNSYCGGVGLVDSEATDRDGSITNHQIMVAAIDRPPLTRLLPPSIPATTPDLASENRDDEPLSVTRVGQIRANATSGFATMPPTWVPGNPPLLLSADQEGEVMAFDARDIGGPVRWRVHVGGSSFGAPGVDPSRGRVYVGSNAKRIYALDSRGLFLWSTPLHDNVVATPVVFGNLVIVSCEDRFVYALDADNGAIRWTFEAAGPIVSSPALIGDTVVVGSDDQTVYGIDAATGSPRWLVATGGAVEGPIAAAGSLALIPGRDGSLSAIGIADCAETCELSWSTKLGDAVRSSPVVLDSDAYVVDESGVLYSIDLDSGDRNWAIGGGYVGPPAVLGHRLIVATRSGELHHLGQNGQIEAIWSLDQARGPIDPAPVVSLGVGAADGAVWIADRNAVLWRLGPPLPAEVPPQLRLRWQVERMSLRGEAERFVSTPIPYGSGLALVDSTGQVQRLDPQTGDLEIVSRLPLDGLLAPIDPTVIGDRLVTVVDQSLVSSGLQPDLAVWQVTSQGSTFRPPVTYGSSVYWASEAADPGSAILRALSAENGAELWSQMLAPVYAAGGALVNNGVVYVGAPPSAFEAATGRQLWQASISGMSLGGPALDTERGRLFVGYAEPGGSGAVAAIDATNGSPVWSKTLPEGMLSVYETLWLTPRTLVVPSVTGSVIGLDPDSGAVRWQYRSPGARLGNVTVFNNQVWLIQENAQIFVVNADTGIQIARLTSLDVNVGTAPFRYRVHVDSRGATAPLTQLLLGLDLPG